MTGPERSRKPGWFARVQRQLRPWQGGRIVVAVSGGSDSVGLLRALNSLSGLEKISLSVAHLDHGSRGEASAADARFVAELSATLGLPCDLGRWSPERSSHFESDARRARYDWLASLARDRGASAVAVGHTRDDQAETILHRIVRGTGPRGLAGMPARRPLAGGVTLIRPLLDVSRSEIRNYLESLGQTWREDATNADRARTRSRIRLDLIPKLQDEYNPKVIEALIRLGRLAGSEHRTCERRLARITRDATVDDPADSVLLVLQLDRLIDLPTIPRAETIRLAWRAAGWPERAMTAQRWRRLAALAGPGCGSGRIALPGGLMAERRGDQLRVLRNAGLDHAPAAPAAALLPLPGSALWGPGRLVASFAPNPPCMESIDAERLEPFGTPDAPHLIVRAAKDGDRFDPLGMAGRTMRLTDFLRNRRVPQHARRLVPLVCDRLGIVWVVGHRIADRVRRVEASRRLLRLRWAAVEEGEGSMGTQSNKLNLSDRR